MADDATGAEATQDVTDAQTPDGDDQQTPEVTADAQGVPGDDFDKDRALALIRKQRQEIKEAQKALKDLDGLRRYREEAENAKLSEQEKLTKRTADLEAQLARAEAAGKDRELRYQVQIAAGAMNIVDTDAAVKLLDWSSVEEGNVQAALQALIEEKPYLVRQDAPQAPQRTPVSPTNPATRQTASASRIWTAAEIADRAVWNANKEEIMRAMRENRVSE